MGVLSPLIHHPVRHPLNNSADILDRREPGRGDLCIRKLTAGHLELFVPGGVLLYLFFSFLSLSLSLSLALRSGGI